MLDRILGYPQDEYYSLIPNTADLEGGARGMPVKKDAQVVCP